MWDLDRVTRWADTIVDSTLVSDVRVVLLVQIPSIPAALEVDLSTHAVPTLCAVHVRLLDRLIVQAVKTDSICNGSAWVFFCAVCHGRVVVASCRFVSGEDHETFGERHCLIDVWSTSKVVDNGTVVMNFIEGAIGIFVVECGRPVCRLVRPDFTGRASRF